LLTYNQILANRIKVIDININMNIKKLTELLIPDYRKKAKEIENTDIEVLKRYKRFLELSGLDYDKLKSMNRKENIVNCRKIICMDLFYRGYTKVAIANIFGKHWTTVVYMTKNFDPKYNLNLKKSLELFIKLFPDSALANLYLTYFTDKLQNNPEPYFTQEFKIDQTKLEEQE